MKIRVKIRRNPYKPGDKIRFVGGPNPDAERYLTRGRIYTVSIACHARFDDGWGPCVWLKDHNTVAFSTKIFKKVK